jgi:hypothetical protein
VLGDKKLPNLTVLSVASLINDALLKIHADLPQTNYFTNNQLTHPLKSII